MGALECNINILLISLMDDTQPYRAEVRDRCVYSNFSYLYRLITVNLMMFLLTIYQTYSKEKYNDLRIEKTSKDFWKQLKAGVDQLYTEYGRSYELLQDRIVHYELAEVSDCPRCILNFVSLIWP